MRVPAGTAMSSCNLRRLHPAECVWGRCGLSRPLCGFLRREAGGSERRRWLPRDCSAAASVGSEAPLRMCGPLWRRRRGLADVHPLKLIECASAARHPKKRVAHRPFFRCENGASSQRPAARSASGVGRAPITRFHQPGRRRIPGGGFILHENSHFSDRAASILARLPTAHEGRDAVCYF